MRESEGKGLYLYCLAAGNLLPEIQATGVEDGASSFVVRYRDIAAVLSAVSLENYTGSTAETRLRDLSWVGSRALRHEEVVEQVRLHSPVLPARFGTIFSSLRHVEELLEVQHEVIAAFLARVMDTDEWSVKGLLDRKRMQEVLLSSVFSRETKRLTALSPGKRYFQEKRLRDEAEKRLSRQVKEACSALVNDVNLYTADFCERKALSTDVTGEEMDMILNGAFLVPRRSLSDFKARIDEADRYWKEQGLSFQLSGPWPPYSFCPVLEMEFPLCRQ